MHGRRDKHGKRDTAGHAVHANTAELRDTAKLKLLSPFGGVEPRRHETRVTTVPQSTRPPILFVSVFPNLLLRNRLYFEGREKKKLFCF